MASCSRSIALLSLLLGSVQCLDARNLSAIINGTEALRFDGDRLKIEFDAFELHHRWLLRRSLSDDRRTAALRQGHGPSGRPMLFRRLSGVVDKLIVNFGKDQFDVPQDTGAKPPGVGASF